MGSVFLYILVATIGMKMDIVSLIENWAMYGSAVSIGLIWMLVHIVVLLLVAKLIKAPFFFVAVGSQANVGGAASAPIVASAFSPALAPVGVLLAVLGYAVGTIGAMCAWSGCGSIERPPASLYWVAPSMLILGCCPEVRQSRIRFGDGLKMPAGARSNPDPASHGILCSPFGSSSPVGSVMFPGKTGD